MIAEFLVFLVAFPRDQNNISGLSHGDGPRDGFFPVDDLLVVLMFESGFDIANDRFRIFLPRIVRGDERIVSVLVRHRSHQRALCFVPVSTASKDQDQPVWIQIAAGFDDIQQRVVGMGIVDKHLKFPLGRHRLEATRDLGRFGQRLHRSPHIQSNRARRRQGGQRIVDIKPADQWKTDQVALVFRIQPVRGPVHLHLEIAGPKIRSGAHSIGDDLKDPCQIARPVADRTDRRY